MKPCRKCGAGTVSLGSLRRYDYRCRACQTEDRKVWERANPEKRRAIQARYNRSRAGSPAMISAGLKCNHGITSSESEYWARVLLDPKTRCTICGLPNSILRAFYERGPWPRFFGRRSRRLELGHIIPSVASGGFVALCHACNMKLGARLFNKENTAAVLRWVRKKWLDPVWGKTENKLWWANKTVDENGHGVGGRLHRNPKFEEAREARWAALRRENEERRGKDGCPPVGGNDLQGQSGNGGVVLETVTG